MSFQVKILFQAKNKTSLYSELEEDYLKRLKSFSFEFIHHKVKEEEKKNSKSLCLLLAELKKKSYHLIFLDERGSLKKSELFSKELFATLEKQGKVCFVLGHSYGFTNEERSYAQSYFSLSPLTMPHHLARLVLVEQLYRAQCIKDSHPYHHD